MSETSGRAPPEPDEGDEPIECPADGCDMAPVGTRALGWHLMHNHVAIDLQ